MAATTKADSPLQPYKADRSDRLYKAKEGKTSNLCATKDHFTGWLIHPIFPFLVHGYTMQGLPAACLMQCFASEYVHKIRLDSGHIAVCLCLVLYTRTH